MKNNLPADDTPMRMCVREADEHHEDKPDKTTDTATTDKQKEKGALSLTRFVALVILAIVIAGLFTVPIVLFILKTNLSNVS